MVTGFFEDILVNFWSVIDTELTLAEQLFVTRQAVSKWERGERYPDLPTTKKISEILDVSLDDLLSGKDMVKEVERNPVVENKAVNNMMLVLYALVVFTCFFYVVGHISVLHSEGANLSEMGGAYIIELIYKFIMEVSPIIVFGYGMYQAIVGTLSLSNVLEIFFNIALYVLFVYQTVVLLKKRQNAQESYRCKNL